MMAKDWGIIEPVRNRWTWPLSQMDEGDFFTVDYADKHPEALRNYVSVRAAQLGRYFSVAKNQPEGFTTVTRVAPPLQRPSKVREEIEFDQAVRLLNRAYRDVNANPLTIWTAHEGDRQRVKAELVREEEQHIFRVMIPDNWNNIVELDEQGFTITRVPLQETVESFTEKRLAAMME